MTHHLAVAWRILVTAILTAYVMFGILYAYHPAAAICVALISAPTMSAAAIMLLRLRKRPSDERVVVASGAINMLLALTTLSTLALTPQRFLMADLLLAGLTLWFGFISYHRRNQIQSGSYRTSFDAKLESPFAIISNTKRPANQ